MRSTHAHPLQARPAVDAVRHEAPWRRWGLAALTALTAYSTALGWQAQLVSYPLYRAVGPEEFARYHELYNQGIVWPVVVPGFACFLGAAAFPWTRPRSVPLAVAAVVGVVGVTCVAATVLWAIPMHDRLDAVGPAAATIDSLLAANLVRTLALSAGTIALSWCVGRLLRRA